MKTLLIPTVLCLFGTFCQAQIKTIKFDFSQPDQVPTETITGIEKGDFYQVVITGINLNLYKVGISTKDTVLSKPQQTPAFGNFQLDALSKLAAGINPLSTLTTVSQPLMLDFAKSVGLLKGVPSFTATTKSIAVNTSIVARMQQEKDDLEASKGRIQKIGIRIDKLKMDVYKTRLNALKTALPGGAFDFDISLIEIEAIRKALLDEMSDMTVSQKKYDVFSTANKSAIEAATDLKENDKSIKEAYEKLITLLTEANASVSADKSVELLSPLVSIQNNKDSQYKSIPQQFTGEQSRLTLVISPRDEKYNLNTFFTQYIFPLKIQRYTSIGISFYGSNLYDDAYSTIKTKLTDSTATYGISRENTGKLEMGIAALLRYGTKLKKVPAIGIHGSLGAGISVSNKIKPRMLLGGGFSFGDKHMLAIDAGGIIGYVDRLSSTVKESSIYPEKPDNLVVSKLEAGIFLSIGYIYQF